MSNRPLLPLLLLSSLAACTESGVGEADPTACGAAAPAPDLDPAEDVVEVALTAGAFDWDPGTGVPVHGLAYNGQVPGPRIEVTQGQTLRVRFTNDLDTSTTIHWHGLRVPEAMDGVSQMEDPVGPGETFTYEFEVIDAGFYWFHPHMATDRAIERGLYGTIVSRVPGEEPASCDVPVVLDDLLLTSADQIAPASMMDTMGRLGNVLLANGRSDTRIPVTSGQVLVLRLVNSSNARYFRLSLPDHVLTVVGEDGGWLAEPYDADELVIAPGQRYIVKIEATGQPGDEVALQTSRYALHAPGSGMMESDPLGAGPTPVLVLAYGEDTVDPESWEPPVGEAPALVAGAITHHWVLDEEGMHTNTIDGALYPNVPMVMAPANTPATFEIENLSSMRHPFHLHGNRFQVLSVDGEPVVPAAWKDTVDVPSGSTVTIASELDNAGEWMYHCHILEHAENGMAGMLEAQ